MSGKNPRFRSNEKMTNPFFHIFQLISIVEFSIASYKPNEGFLDREPLVRLMSKDIAYGAELEALSETPTLLRQICLRLDRHFPNAADKIAADEAMQAVRLVISDAVTKLEQMGFNEIADQLGSVIK